MTRTNYDERRDLERVILNDITAWGDDLGINDAILRCIEDADRLEEMEGKRVWVRATTYHEDIDSNNSG
jgi:hypothetical protein